MTRKLSDWWTFTDATSPSPQDDKFDTGLYNGDEPAEILTTAIDEIVQSYKNEFGRPPYNEELWATWNFIADPTIIENHGVQPTPEVLMASPNRVATTHMIKNAGATAKDSYESSMREINRMLKVIGRSLDEHNSDFQKNQNNYGYAGDLSLTLERLNQINKYLTGRN